MEPSTEYYDLWQSVEKRSQNIYVTAALVVKVKNCIVWLVTSLR